MSSVILAQSGDTWGITGPEFLAGYLIVGAGLYFVALRARATVKSVGTGASGRRGREFVERFTASAGDDPYLLAFLNGGSRLAVLAGQSALRAHGLLGEGSGAPRTASPRTAPAHASAASPSWPLELALLSATAGRPVPYSRLKSDPAVADALRDLFEELVQHRLLVSEQRRDRLRLWGLVLLALFALGAYRLVEGIGNSRPVGFLIPLTLLAGAGAALWYLRLPRRTPAGEAALDRLRGEYAHLAPTLRPDWAANGPAAALGVAVFGVDAIWVADPAFADELELSRATSAVVGSPGAAGSGGSPGWRLRRGSSGSGSSSGGGGGCGG